MNKRTVFISSTFEDLKDHRSKIWEVLEDFEVHVNGMEKFGARKESPLDTCLEEVNRSDIYVGIISMKFGSVEQETGKSFTQLEYEKALEADKDILIYLINEDQASIQTKNIDFGEKHNKLENFKAELREKHTVDFFTTPGDLAGKLKHVLEDKLERTEVEKDEDTAEEILKRFYLFPNEYSGNEIEIDVEFTSSAFPASKAVCNTFGFNYGETIVQPITVVSPSNAGKISELVITKEHAEWFFDLEDGGNLKILARLMFSENTIDGVEGHFFDEERTNLIFEPNSIQKYTLDILKRNPIHSSGFREEKEFIEGEGKALLLFRKIKD